MERPKLIISKGHPGTGKSILCTDLASRLQCPVIDRDRIKLELFQQGTPRSILGARSYERMWDFAISVLQRGSTVICDTGLNQPEDLPKIEAISQLTQSKPAIIEVYCSDTEIHKARLENRPNNDFESLRIGSWREYLEWLKDPTNNVDFDIPFPHLRVDGSKPFALDYIVSWINALSHNPDFSGSIHVA